MALRTVDLKPRIGTEIIADTATLLSGTYASELRTLLEERGILLFRRVNFSEDEQVAFSRTLGTVFEHKGDSVQKISMDKNVMKEAEYFQGSFLWHFDGSTDDLPPRASLLSARVLAKTGGGETEWASTSAAYDDLPEQAKATYDKVRVLHSLASDYRIAALKPNEATLTFWRDAHPIPKSHPLVWHHKSGRNSLLVGATAAHVDGGALDDAVLARLLDWVTQPQYVYRHSWEVGDLIVYDNTVVIHRALPYDADSGRILQRTKLVGEEECV